ncbi:MAG TPA: hypothetical protein DCE18_13415 [Syntrophobacteraceae bacterium]|jgi:hypothetical protein|nr:hypothetical protein [Syntrophobacteraceae bacterium]
MPTYQEHVFTMDLAALQAAGDSYSGDFMIGGPLPDDSVTMGSQIEVLDALAGPGLTKATATINLGPGSRPPCDLVADLMSIGMYRCGGQQYRLQVFLEGCMMDALTAGALKVAIFYGEFAA